MIDKKIKLPSRSEIIQRAKKSGMKLSRVVHTANISKGNLVVWWLDIRESVIKVESEISLLLYDYRNDNLYYLRIPTLYFKENKRGLDIKPASGGHRKIRLHLSTDNRDLFTDKRGSGRVSFHEFLTDTVAFHG